MGKRRRDRSASGTPAPAPTTAPSAPAPKRVGLRLAVTVALAIAGAALAVWYARRTPRTDAEARKAIARLRPQAGGLNLVVVTLDTTRADRLGCYGFKGIETPNIDGLARDGIVFDHATAT